MRILITTPTFFPIVGGAELLIRDVGNVWSEEHDVRLLTGCLPATSQPYWVNNLEGEQTCRFDIVRFDDRWSLMRSRGHRFSHGLLPPMSLSALAAINREAGRFKPDLLVTFFAVPFGLPSVIAKYTRRVPLMLVLCGNDLPGPRTARLPMWASYSRFATATADRVVYVSNFCFQALERRPFEPPHDVVMYGGVDADVLHSTPEAAKQVRARLGLGDDDVMLFALQRLAPEKRVDVLVRAFAMLPQYENQVHLVIGGQGGESARLQDLAIQLGVADRVRFVGHLGAEKADYYAAADIFVFHSIFETFGQVVAEAMMSGKPVVSVRAGAIAEVVADGVTGLLAEPNEPTSLAGYIAALVEDKDAREAMGVAGRHRAREMFDWSRMADRWRSVIRLDEEDAFVRQGGEKDMSTLVTERVESESAQWGG